MQTIATELDGKARLRDLDVQERERQREAEQRHKNLDFVQVYPEGWERLKTLIVAYPLAARVYAFFAQHIEPGTGAVVVGQEIIAEEMGITTRSVRRVIKYLEENSAIVKIKLHGTLHAYAVNEKEVWKSWNDKKRYSAFNTKTLARSCDNGDVKRKLEVMLKGTKKEMSEQEKLEAMGQKRLFSDESDV